jgi:hypothetical protein
MFTPPVTGGRSVGASVRRAPFTGVPPWSVGGVAIGLDKLAVTQPVPEGEAVRLPGGTLAPRLPTERVNQTQLLPVLVDMNDIETSDPPRHPAARGRSRGPGQKALAAVVLSGVALVIFGELTLKTVLVIAAVSAIVAAARRYRPKK